MAALYLNKTWFHNKETGIMIVRKATNSLL